MSADNPDRTLYPQWDTERGSQASYLLDDEPEPAPVSDQPQPKAQPIVQPAAPPSDAGLAAISAKEAKSLFSDLGIDTAIRLRWAMRDIRGKRTKWSPISENDLAELIDLGLVEIREGVPTLTDFGSFALD